jgi:ABC-type lipoprotein release transport system permease subunit
MMLFIRLAWRNILRNKRRTFIAGTAIGIGLAAMIFVDALFQGMMRHMIRSATATYMGEAQIHRNGFRDTFDAGLTIDNVPDLRERLAADPRVKHYVVRTSSYAMLASSVNSSGVSLVGTEPARERDISQVDDVMVEGTFFEGDSPRDIVIGSGLAELLEVELGDRLVVTASQAHTGALAQDLFRVSGIYHFNIEDMDKSMAFIRLEVAQKLLGMDGTAHEIAISFGDPILARDLPASYWASYSDHDNEAEAWTTLVPQLNTIMNMSNLNLIISGAILFGVVALGIINTLFMSLYERMFEFGVLRAIGTRPRSLLRLVMLEAAGLAVIAIVLGVIIALGVSLWVKHIGIDYGNLEMAGVTLRDKIYPTIRWSQYLVYPAWAFVLTTLVGIYPAFHASRVSPAEAMRKSF